MSKEPVVVHDDDVAHAWAKAFDAITNDKTGELSPMVVCVTGFENGVAREDQDIRTLLDDSLKSHGLQSIRTVASTIFPSSLWNPARPASDLFRRYKRLLPQLRKCPLNRNGIYFERMIAYLPRNSSSEVNQIDYILSTRNSGNHRRSAYQISILDPTRDDTDQRQRGFPCLQQVSVTPIGGSELALTGYYATQTMFERAYGNYLGLCELGRFFAHAFQMNLNRVTCVASLARLDTNRIPAHDARALADATMEIVVAKQESVLALTGDVK